MENNEQREKQKPYHIGISIKVEQKNPMIWACEMKVKTFQLKDFLKNAGFNGKMEYTGKVNYKKEAEQDFLYIKEFYGNSKEGAYLEAHATYNAIMHQFQAIMGLTGIGKDSKTVLPPKTSETKV
jgi:coproporphyrinogen III oxidase